MGSSLLLAVTAAAWIEGAEVGPREPCPATPLWEALAQDIPDTRDHRKVHRRIAWGLELARKADDDPTAISSTSQCLESVLGYGDAAYVYYYGTEQAEQALRRSDALAAGLRAELDALLAAPPPPPPPEPMRVWMIRERQLVIHTSFSATFTGLAILTATVPWVVVVACCDSYTVAGTMTLISLPVGIAAGAATAVWASLLARHRRTPPPGITWHGSLVRFGPPPRHPAFARGRRRTSL